MKALLVLDMQKGLMKKHDFKEIKEKIIKLINLFNKDNYPIIFTQHIKQKQESSLNSIEDLEIDDDIMPFAEEIIKKNSPSAFFNTQLDHLLKNKGIKDVVIVGFNTEYCCLFTSIAAFDRGYNVYFIEDAIGTSNNENTYEMPGLDINDFIGSLLNWSEVINVPYYEEYIGMHNN